MRTLTIHSGTSKVLSHQFMLGRPVPFTRKGSNQISSDLDLGINSFKPGDRVGLCVADSLQRPEYVPGQCPRISANIDGTVTVSGVSLPEGASGSLYAVPGLRGMWLGLEFSPLGGSPWLTSPIVTQAGSAQIVVCGCDGLKVGDNVELRGVLGFTQILAVRSFSLEDGRPALVLSVGSPAVRSVKAGDRQALLVLPHKPIKVVGARAKSSAGGGTCGGLQLTISRDVSRALAQWGRGFVGYWTLTLNNGWSTSSPWTSDLLQAGALYVK